MSKKLKVTYPRHCVTPLRWRGIFFKSLSLFDFLFPSGEGCRGGLYFALFSLSSDATKWHSAILSSVII